MTKTITISIPVADLPASQAFYTALGFENNPAFSGETAALRVWSETISVMLLTHERWRGFTDRPISPGTSSRVGLIVSCDSRHGVDAMNEAAATYGGTADINPIEDHGFMYTRDFTDPDGQVWGEMLIDPNAAPPHA